MTVTRSKVWLPFFLDDKLIGTMDIENHYYNAFSNLQYG